MNNSNKFWTIAGVVLAFLSFVGLCITLYENRNKPTILEIKTISEIELTRPLNVEHLSSSYLYDSIPVEHLWQSSFVITNTGETTLYGEGFEEKNIKGKSLLIHLKNCDNLLSIESVEGNTDVFLLNGSLYFSQWRPNEYVEIKVLADGPRAPELQVNERDIKEGNVIYTKYSPEEKLAVKRWIDHLPMSVSKALWWVVLGVYILMFILSIINLIIQYQQAEDKTTKNIIIVVGIIANIFLSAPLLWMF